jgi:hypothetical protein
LFGEASPASIVKPDDGPIEKKKGEDGQAPV